MHVRAHMFAILLAVGPACGVGDASGPGGDGDGAGDGGGDGPGGGGNRPDAAPEPVILCMTPYTVSGDIVHVVPPAGSCDGRGTWNVTMRERPIDPAEPDEYDRCLEAPAEESYSLSVTRDGEGIYSATEPANPGRAWRVQVRDKGGSCHATFTHERGEGAVLSLTPGETSPDGPIEGRGNLEVREE